MARRLRALERLSHQVHPPIRELPVRLLRSSLSFPLLSSSRLPRSRPADARPVPNWSARESCSSKRRRTARPNAPSASTCSTPRSRSSTGWPATPWPCTRRPPPPCPPRTASRCVRILCNFFASTFCMYCSAHPAAVATVHRTCGGHVWGHAHAGAVREGHPHPWRRPRPRHVHAVCRP
jgi:hypothetical protein